MSDPAINETHVMEQLSSAFEDPDRLKPIRCLSELLRIQDPEHFLIKESIGNKLQNWAGILGTIASTITAVVGAMTTLKIPGLS